MSQLAYGVESRSSMHGHAHLLAKVGVISSMSKNIPCSVKSIGIDQKGLFESTLGFDIHRMAPIFFPPASLTNLRHHAKLFKFFTSFAFSEVFSIKKDR